MRGGGGGGARGGGFGPRGGGGFAARGGMAPRAPGGRLGPPPRMPGGRLGPPPRAPGFAPAAGRAGFHRRGHGFGPHHGPPSPAHGKPGKWPWWKPWGGGGAGFWPGWAPWWWGNWGGWATDVVYVYDAPYVLIWIDYCSDEYARAYADGTLEIPEYWEGYPVLVQWTCGEVVDEPLAGFGASIWPEDCNARATQCSVAFPSGGTPEEIAAFNLQCGGSSEACQAQERGKVVVYAGVGAVVGGLVSGLKGALLGVVAGPVAYWAFSPRKAA